MPARNERARLPALLDALVGAYGRVGGGVTLCLLLDGCTDDSAAYVRSRLPDLPFPLMLHERTGNAEANAGCARAAAMALGLETLGDAGGLLLSTDADSRPAPDWIACMVEALGRADIVAGRIVRPARPPSPLQDRIGAFYDRLYALRRQLDPVPWDGPATHHFTGGANLGFRADAYRALGGFLPLAAGEDARIVDDAGRAGLRVRRDPAPLVVSSARRHGRAPGGLAASLRRLDRDDGVTLAHPADCAWQYRMHARARAAYAAGTPQVVAAAIGLTADHAIGVARDCPNAEAFAMRVVPTPPDGIRTMPLGQAEAVLAALETSLLEGVA